jgi:transaldolase
MEKQAIEIASWGKNINVKIPITNTKKESTTGIIERLSNQGIECNITAIFTVNQLKNVVQVLNKNTPAILSVFAGRIADTGIDPKNIMAECVQASKLKPKSEILWASTRELVNIFQADKIGCQIITVPHEILSKIDSIGTNLEDYSLDTVKSFYKDAVAAGFKINTK